MSQRFFITTRSPGHSFGVSLLPGVSAFPIALAAIIVRTDKRLIEQLTEAGANREDVAVPIAAGNRLRRKRLARLVSAGAIRRHPSDDRFYLDEAGWEAFRQGRRRRVLIALGIALIAVVVVWVANN